MSQQHAAGTPDESPDRPTTDGVPAVPAAPRDERPRPRYGEYAPEGWTWRPPADEPVTNAAPAPESAPAMSPAGAAGAPAAAAHPTDRAWTVALLVLGAFGAVYNALTLILLPQSVLESARLSASVLGTEAPTSFTAGPAVPAVIVIGVVLQATLWVGAMLWSRARIRAGRLAWWVPVVAGIAAFTVVLVASMIVFASDPAFFQFLSRVGA
ncbi:DUF6264 family protein [Agromyces sp. NPDC058484]|uniref:DUF6264 family protein n=1 Tax=Agromyces sp. NPDC058484 TaxID=3346524 RepID=UPI003650EFC8